MLRFNGPFAAGDHMVEEPPYWRANCALRHLKQGKFKLRCFVLDVPAQCVICSPEWRFLYHLIASCKGPIAVFISILFLVFGNWELTPARVFLLLSFMNLVKFSRLIPWEKGLTAVFEAVM